MNSDLEHDFVNGFVIPKLSTTSNCQQVIVFGEQVGTQIPCCDSVLGHTKSALISEGSTSEKTENNLSGGAPIRQDLYLLDYVALGYSCRHQNMLLWYLLSRQNMPMQWRIQDFP